MIGFPYPWTVESLIARIRSDLLYVPSRCPSAASA
jgi:hypothetical protein